MHLLKLILRNTFRHRLRSLLTALGIGVAVLAFGLLRTVVDAWYAGVAASAQNRLVARNAVSLVFPLPLAYRNQIAVIRGVTGISYGNWFGGVYIDEKNFFAQFAVDPPTYMDLYPEFRMSDAEREAFYRDRKGCAVGRKLAAKYGWKVGDTIQIQGTIYPGDWDFVIRAIYRGAEPSTDETVMFFHWDRLNEAIKRAWGVQAGNQVGWYVLRITRPDDAGPISDQVDAMFKNTLAETRTETERAFQMGFVSMAGTIIVALRVISGVVLAIILLVLANTMAMAARERLSEYGVLKTLGFRPGHLIGIIAGESLAIAGLGAALGVALTIPVCNGFAKFVTENLGSFFPVFRLSPETVYLSVGASFAVGLLAALFPCARAVHIRIVDAIRRVD
ncbi:MAG: ABC transporter ATP-binding protein [Candidatus Handelsmanbacteria bacterium RIFCSPLOWO2_12_FULL_64_10]|uniref:ABC transporter ATP-binding protein n=1 Tax=Handelsmanbacteria sp. (strain RIFCSPLOWO2_12_FULL_64_10) TaxID=1817868 RepID=A0A1F6CDI8_HANXR|nr:MAG: ABC transporter ATP-binding protein [Candidatus Handelsmanbacteria bacterium RIFCSPLOWO2_12_FULL_64_10]